MSGCPVQHGVTKARGCEHVAVGSFSKLFPKAGNVVLREDEAVVLGGAGGIMHDYNGESPDSGIPAGYIFFAQFIDHEITLDATSPLRGTPLGGSEVEKLPNVRSASLDLDCVYGFGPEASPHLYDPRRPGRLAVHPNGFDLARSPSDVALIGDPRNDENIFVAQMQLLFHRVHNRIYEERVGQSAGSRFEEAQRQTRYHYQWIVLFDFLKRLCDPDVYAFAVDRLLDGKKPLVYKPDAHGKLAMPVEFSVAAYRVGHTLVRSSYAINAQHTDVELFDERFSALGFRAVPQELVVDWRYLLEVEACVRPRMCKAIDPLLADELQDLPVVSSRNPVERALAFRNLMRASTLGLPSGQAVANALHGAGYAAIDPGLDLQLDDVGGFSRLDELDKTGTSHLRKETPLFYYVLRESQLKSGGQRFGPVGSALLLEVFGGMLAYCATSVLHEADWQPDPCISKERYNDWSSRYKEGFNRKALVHTEGYYPLELADLVRFVT